MSLYVFKAIKGSYYLSSFILFIIVLHFFCIYSRLKTELQFLRKKGALKVAVGQDQVPGAGLDHAADHGHGHNNGRCCARCRTGLGRIINRGALCKSCRQRVCKACREYNLPKSSTGGTDWVCTVCYKQA